MLLSIGMIVKNEEKYLERCLTALKPILENVDSELIIADTGSTDNTVEIAKKFTDKVYYFEWINDFSAARNYTMEKSVGEWFMFLDADEIFQSCDDIIHFFNSGEYRNYGNASYTVRSYIDESDMTVYSDSFVMRLAKRFPDVWFCNKIHEALSPLHGKMKFLTTIADHYGYFYNNNGVPTEAAFAKSRRNLDLLLKCLEEPKVEYNVYKEIADCYSVIGEKEKSIEYAKKGLEVLDHNHIAINQYYSFIAVAFMSIKRYDEAIEICNDYFGSGNSSRKTTIATDVDMYAIRGESYYRNGEYEQALSDLREFFKVYNEYKSNRLITDDLLYNNIKVKDNNVKYLFYMLIETCIELQEYGIAEEYIKRFNVENYQNDRQYMLAYFYDRVKIMQHTGWKSAKKFISSLDDENKKQFFRVLRVKMFYTDKKEELINVLSDFKNIVPGAQEVIEIYRSYCIKNDLQYEIIKSFIEKYGANGNNDIFFIMLNCGMEISCFLTADGFNAEDCIYDIYTDFSDMTFLLNEYDVDRLLPEAVVSAASLYGWAMVKAVNEGKSIADLFEIYGKIAAKWKNEFPNEKVIPGDIRVGEYVRKITEARKIKDYQTCISEMRLLIKVCPHFAPIVSEYRKIIEQEISSPKDAKSELSEMAEMVKRNIRAMLDAGDISSAEKTLLELGKLCPADAEIGMLKYDIKMRKNR